VKDSLAPLSAKDVKDVKTFARFCQQTMGMPLPRLKDYPILAKQVKLIFAQHPNADWQTMCRLTEWARNRKKRFAYPQQLVSQYRLAWADGYLPELDPSHADPETEAGITRALATEKDPEWRRRMIRAQGVNGRKKVYEAWKAEQSSSLSPA
jgi:hypothetical protein